MKLHRLLLTLAFVVCGTVAHAQAKPAPAKPALDDPNTVVTVMQFTANTAATRPQLQERMRAIRDYLRTQPGYVENVLMENRNSTSKPDYVGVSRWKSVKDWEALWLKPEFQKLVASVAEVGTLNPGIFSPVKH